MSEAGVVDALEALINRRPRLTPAVLEVAITAATKLTARLPSQVGGSGGMVVVCDGGGVMGAGMLSPCGRRPHSTGNHRVVGVIRAADDFDDLAW